MISFFWTSSLYFFLVDAQACVNSGYVDSSRVAPQIGVFFNIPVIVYLE
ncbi:hypothetical protein GFK82_00700 [Candidatus Steffania adelgidicola]|nr:hypothetical protein GFK82_00700 [Candidatus Steffania adelgidicola]